MLLYALVCGGLLLRWAVGLALSLRLLKASALTGQKTNGIEIRESSRILSPVTLGIVRPAIVLPAGWREWNSVKLDDVLAHERSHVARHDPAIQMLSMIHRAILWFSPASWLLHGTLVRTAEEASADAAIAASPDRASYARILQKFMQQGVRDANWQGVPMARYVKPEQRIDRILDGTSLSRGVTRRSLASILVMAIPLGYAVAAAEPQASQPAKLPTFEVASVKPTPPEGRRGGATMTGGPGSKDPGRIHYTNMSLEELLLAAYDLNGFQVAGPPFLSADRFDLDATMPPGTSKEQFRLMLQGLLADRFQLMVHRETRELAGYNLVVTDRGPKMKESAELLPPVEDGAPPPPLALGVDGYFVPPKRRGVFFQFTEVPNGRAVFRQVTMQELASTLQRQMKRPVSDATGLTARYDFKLDYSTQGLDMGRGRIPVSPGDRAYQNDSTASNGPADAHLPYVAPGLLSALPSQLGLKLESKRVPVETLVIDHVVRNPIAN